MLTRAATFVQVFQVLFYYMFYFTCDRSFTRSLTVTAFLCSADIAVNRPLKEIYAVYYRPETIATVPGFELTTLGRQSVDIGP